MKKHLLFLIGLISFVTVTNGQEDYFLTPQNKAYIYHTVRKSPILERNVGHYIVYEGTEIKFQNGEINYDSTEQIIINNPELLRIYTREISRSPKGILAELANKMAVWELNTALQSYRSKSLVKDGKETDYQLFESLLSSGLPQVAWRTRKGNREIHPKVLKLSNPTLTFKDKIAMLDGFGSWTNEEKEQVIKAYNNAVNEWVSNRSLAVFKLLGGRADLFINVLTAAGDGSSTSGLFEEREKDERGRFNRGLPRAVGLFPYDTYIGIKPNSKKKKPDVLSMGHTIQHFETIGNGRETNIHLDVWGYNSEKQTTVVITKSGRYYPLFGAENTRFLSPDSAYAGGMTYYTLIHRVEKEVQELEEKISGKRGIDYQIAYLEDLKQGKNLSIDKTEKEISVMRSRPTTTKTSKKKGLKSSAKTSSKRKRQEKVISLYNEVKGIEKKIEALKVEKENILFKKQNTERHLQEMIDLIGKKWVPYKEKDGLYIFEDSTRFDQLTQEFIFPASEDQEVVEVKLIAMPVSHLSKQYDEVMLHINVTDAIPLYTSKVQLRLADQFGVDKFDLLQKPLFMANDSIAIVELFKALLDKKKEFRLIVRGGGVGKWYYDRVVTDYDNKEKNQYPGSSLEERQTAREDARFKRLRSTELLIQIDRTINLQVNSYTDPVKSNFVPKDKKMEALMRQNKWSGNQVLSAYRAWSTLKQMKDELNVLAGQYLAMEDASKVIDRINRAVEKSKISVGKTSVKYKVFK